MLKKLLPLFLFPAFYSAQVMRTAVEWKSDKDLKSASIGFCVMNARTSAILAEQNSTTGLIPASTLKVVTTTAALGLLGPNYKYETKIAYTGTLDKTTGVLNGDLIITGSGDPTLQSELFSKDSPMITDKWAKAIKEKGIKEIKGRITGNASYFSREVPGSWIWADIGNYFGTVPCGLSFMDNKFKIIYTSKESGSKAIVNSIAPNYLGNTITLNSSVIAKGSEDEAYVYGDPFGYSKEVTGTIPPNKTNYEVEAALPDPALLCAEMLYTSLTAMGVKCNKNAAGSSYKKNDSTVAMQVIYTHFSPTLDKIIHYTNMKSNNLYCESILRAMGKGSLTAGLEAVKNYWQARGLGVDELFMADGSGLSRANTVSTAFQASLLSKVYRDSVNYRVFNASLPVSGKHPGMANIGKGTFIDNNMRAKTGYINRARGYCGYVRTRSGKDLAFSVLMNNYNCTAKEAKTKLEKFLIELAEL